MKLLTPCTYRLRPDQEKWLREKARKQHHNSKSVSLRILIDRAISEEARKKGAA